MVSDFKKLHQGYWQPANSGAAAGSSASGAGDPTGNANNAETGNNNTQGGPEGNVYNADYKDVDSK